MAADDALIQAMRESCRRLWQQQIFYNRGPHFSHAVICVISLTNIWIGSKSKDFPSGNVL